MRRLSKFSKLLLCFALIGCSKAQFGSPKANDLKGVSVLEKNAAGSDLGALGKSEMVAEAQPAIVIEAAQPAPLAMSPQFTLKQNVFALDKAKPVEVNWVLNADLPGLDVFTITVMGSDEKIILQQEVTPVSLIKGAENTFKFDFAMEQNVTYTFSIGGYNKDRSYIQPAQGTILVDSVAPQGRIYLGAQGSSNPCAKPPTASDFVSTRVVPAQMCLDDQKGLGSGVEKYCLLQNTLAAEVETPNLTDACWRESSDLTTQVLLTSEGAGSNYFHLFMIDKVGNIGKDLPQLINIIPSEPPKVNIVSPTSSELASSKWIAGQDKVVSWTVSDADTLALDIRIVITLLNRDNREDFFHLACSFSDASDAPKKLCPNPSLASSPSIIRREDGSGQYNFKVGNWDLNKPYLLAVTAIDKAGNASVISTSEINADWEVIAGRSYNGFGGSGTTLQSNELTHLIATDKLGQLLNTSASKDGNLKIRALDGRSCRFTKNVGRPATAFDCDDIIETNETILGRVWTYIEHRDSFYVSVDGVLKEIDFKSRTVKRVMGLGNAPLPVNAETKPTSTISVNTNLSSYLAYEPKSKSIFFFAQNRLYRIDSNQMVSFVVGSGVAATGFPGETSKKASELDIPSIYSHGFVVSADGRVMFTSPTPPHWNNGGSVGLVYVIDGLSWGQPDKIASLKALGGETATQAAVAPNNQRTVFWYAASYNQKENAVYYLSSWTGVYKIVLPPPGSTEDKYIPVPIFLSSDSQPFNSFKLAMVPNTTVGYMSESTTGSVITFDTVSKSSSIYTGTREKLSSSSATLSDNVSINLPRYFHRSSDSEIYFTDRTGLKKTALDSAGRWKIIDLNNANTSIYWGAVRIFEGIQKIFHFNYDYLNLLAPATLTSPASEEIHNFASAHRGSYPRQFGHSNSKVTPKLLVLNTSWDGKRVAKAQLYFTDYKPNPISSSNSQINLLATYTIGSPYCGANRNLPCPQGVPQIDARGGNYFTPGTYAISGSYGNQGLAAFSSDDQIAYTCGNSKFIAIEIATKKIFEFDAQGNDGSKLRCPFSGASFAHLNGEIYYSEFGSFYKLNLSSVFATNRATFSKLNYGRFPVGFTPNQFQLFPNGSNYWLYATDLNSHRLFRKEVSL